MSVLKESSSVLFLTFFFVCGCTTSSFKTIKQGDLAVELKVTPDRILLECEPQPGHEIEGAHGFFIHILDDTKTVITVAQFNILDKDECYSGLREIAKILRTGKLIYLGGMGDLKASREGDGRKYTFSRLGTFYSNGKTLKFIVIANEQGLCFDAQDGDKGQCPREPFSLKNLN
jgi:hypothetical protein